MTSEILELENRRLRGQLQMADSRARLALEALALFQERLLQVATTFTVEDIAELITRLEAIQRLLAGIGEGDALC
jgi:hypothetical protein